MNKCVNCKWMRAISLMCYVRRCSNEKCARNYIMDDFEGCPYFEQRELPKKKAVK